MWSEIRKLINSLWNMEEFPDHWKEFIIVPIYKRGNKTDCSNYHGISLLSTIYKILSNNLFPKLSQYVDEIIGYHWEKTYCLIKLNKKWPFLSKRCFIQFNIIKTEKCECGEAKETINHILRQWKFFEQIRVHMIDDLMKCKIFPPYCIKAILYCMLPEEVIPVV
jgi:hypothetical protein